MKEDYLVKVENEGEVLVHIRNIGPTDHVTVCGLDGHDGGEYNHLCEQKVLPLNRGDRMNCPMCRIYYDNRSRLNVPARMLDNN